MASFFGEVVSQSSRAFWHEEDEDGPTEREITKPAFNVRWLKEKPDRINTLVVVEHEMLTDFTKECLCQDAEEACIIEDEKEQKNRIIIYHINDSVYLCTVSSHFNVTFSGLLMDKMSDLLQNTEKRICITYRHISYFKSKDIPTVPSFLRMLTTKNGKNICPLKETFLEQPNIVYGVASAVLSYAEFMDLPSVLYILYTDSFELDSLSAEPLVKLFAAMNCTPHGVTFTGNKFFNKGNLYM